MAKHLVDTEKLEAKAEASRPVVYRPSFVRTKAERQADISQAVYEMSLTHGRGYLPQKSGKDVKPYSDNEKFNVQIALAEMQARTTALNAEEEDALRFMKRYGRDYDERGFVESLLKPQFEERLYGKRGILPKKSGKNVGPRPEIDLQIALGQMELREKSARNKEPDYKEPDYKNVKLVSDLQEFRADMIRRQRIARGEIVPTHPLPEIPQYNFDSLESFLPRNYKENPIKDIISYEPLFKEYKIYIKHHRKDPEPFVFPTKTRASDYGLSPSLEPCFALDELETPNKLYKRFLA